MSKFKKNIEKSSKHQNIEIDKDHYYKSSCHYYENQNIEKNEKNVEKNEKNIKSLSFVKFSKLFYLWRKYLRHFVKDWR
jgi:hypothetical protein